MSVIRRLLIVAAWNQTYQDAKVPSVSVEAQVAHISSIEEMLDVERLKAKTLHADALRFRAEKLQISEHVDRSKEKVAQ